MELLEAFILGVIEGLTEFLPISSTGHLIVAQDYLGFKDRTKAFTVVIQMGAILAVAWHYRNDLLKRIKGLFSIDEKYTRFWTNIIIAVIPAAFVGLLLDREFEERTTSTVVAIALIAGALVLWWVDRKPVTDKEAPVKLDDITKKQAVTVGLVQITALIPGVSRSGATIVGGLYSKMNRPTATAFSFYLGMVVLGLASAYKLATDWDELGQISGGISSIFVAATAAFITALIAVTWLLRYISTHNFRIFVYYRIILGILILVFLV